MMPEIQVKRVYVEPDATDGFRVLVDRPRGQSKATLALDLWAKNLAPSTPLRQAWHHEPENFAAFAEAYRNELSQNPDLTNFVKLLATYQRVTLLYAARNEQSNHAIILREYLLAQLLQR